MLQQLFVDAAKVLHRQVAIVDPTPPDPWLGLTRHLLDDEHQFSVWQAQAGQDIAGAVPEQAAVVGRQTKGAVAG